MTAAAIMAPVTRRVISAVRYVSITAKLYGILPGMCGNGQPKRLLEDSQDNLDMPGGSGIWLRVPGAFPPVRSQVSVPLRQVAGQAVSGLVGCIAVAPKMA